MATSFFATIALIFLIGVMVLWKRLRKQFKNMIMQDEETTITTGKPSTKTDGGYRKMRLIKGMAYYFMFWILYLPLSIVITLMLNFGLEEFFVSLGLGAIILLAFLSIRLLIIKLSEKDSPSFPSSKNVSEAPIPEDNLEIREKTAAEVKNEEVQLA